MASGKLTLRAIGALAKTDRTAFLWDEELSGFGLRMTANGAKSYVFQYRMGGREATKRRITIGKHGSPWTPDTARTEAKRLALMVGRGIDPYQAELDAIAAKDAAKRAAEESARVNDEMAFEKIAAKWLKEYELGHRPRSYGQAKLVINKHLTPTLAAKPLPSITRADMLAILDGIPASQPATRRTVYAYASIFFGWALRRGDIAESPVAMMAKPAAAKARDRVLSDTELATIWRGTDTIRAPLGAFYRVLLLTGQRREEVAGMTWAELDRATATWTIPASRAKNGAAQIVPLAPMVVAELDGLALARQVLAEDDEPDATRWPKAGPVMSIRGDVSLSCFSQAKRLLDAEVVKAAEDDEHVAPWRLHDLRRTLATGLQRLGVRFEVTEAVLNHVSGAKGGVAGIYQRHDWKEEKRAALDAWARHVEGLLAPADQTNVATLKGRVAA